MKKYLITQVMKMLTVLVTFLGKKKLLTAKRFVNNLEGTLDENNYNAILPPSEKKRILQQLYLKEKKPVKNNYLVK